MSARSLAPNAARLSKYPGRASGSLNWDCAAVVHWRGGRADACLTTRSYVAVGSRLIGPDVAGSYSPEAGTQLCGMGTGSGQAGTTSARQGPKRDDDEHDNSSKLGRRGEAHLVSEHARVALELALLNPVSDQGTVQLALVEAREGLLVLRHRGRECDWKWNKP